MSDLDIEDIRRFGEINALKNAISNQQDRMVLLMGNEKPHNGCYKALGSAIYEAQTIINNITDLFVVLKSLEPENK
jgi:hypothetical protein